MGGKYPEKVISKPIWWLLIQQLTGQSGWSTSAWKRNDFKAHCPLRNSLANLQHSEKLISSLLCPKLYRMFYPVHSSVSIVVIAKKTLKFSFLLLEFCLQSMKTQTRQKIAVYETNIIHKCMSYNSVGLQDRALTNPTLLCPYRRYLLLFLYQKKNGMP